MISGYHHEVGLSCAFPGYYAASIGTLEDGTDLKSFRKKLCIVSCPIQFTHLFCY